MNWNLMVVVFFSTSRSLLAFLFLNWLTFPPILASYNPNIPSANTPSGNPTPIPTSFEPTSFAFGQLVCVGHALALVEQGGQENSPVSEGFVVAVVVAALENGSLNEIVVLLKQFVAFTSLTFSSRAKIMSTHYSSC
jgi:hypothetical protein